ncbi:predicted protein [Histoplasma capsulatum var. duboisii H88]|uniref:Predicted protein n=1 Tax=Ajellomyces capsulatus (strain H88) TaxID=544711 RepID=F0U8F8_AJEC8|nr:predicted protein [Histoplasma capsulatum var. duboisii H88]
MAVVDRMPGRLRVDHKVGVESCRRSRFQEPSSMFPRLVSRVEVIHGASPYTTVPSNGRGRRGQEPFPDMLLTEYSRSQSKPRSPIKYEVLLRHFLDASCLDPNILA